MVHIKDTTDTMVVHKQHTRATSVVQEVIAVSGIKYGIYRVYRVQEIYVWFIKTVMSSLKVIIVIQT